MPPILLFVILLCNGTLAKYKINTTHILSFYSTSENYDLGTYFGGLGGAFIFLDSSDLHY